MGTPRRRCLAKRARPVGTASQRSAKICKARRHTLATGAVAIGRHIEGSYAILLEQDASPLVNAIGIYAKNKEQCSSMVDSEQAEINFGGPRLMLWAFFAIASFLHEILNLSGRVEHAATINANNCKRLQEPPRGDDVLFKARDASRKPVPR